MKLAKLAPIVAVVFVGAALGGRSYAYFTAGGTGTGAAEVGGVDELTPLGPVGGGANADPMFPGGAGDIVVHVRNPNSFPVEVVRVRRLTNTLITSSVPACALHVSVVAIVDVAPGTRLDPGETRELRLVDAATLSEVAPDDCQGATFTIPVSVEIATVVS